MPNHLAAVSTGEAEPASTSESEEMYLITVARAVESGRAEPVPTPAIAESLAVSVASANEMVHRLAARGLLTYEPYRGVGLTVKGRTVASRVLRTRRLWATFLAEHLGFDPVSADDQACHLEHVTDPTAVERLADFLGNPTTDPQGQSIPAADEPGAAPAPPLHSLGDAVPGEIEVVSVRLDAAAAAFLSGEGIRPGARITVLAKSPSAVLVDTGTSVHLANALAAAIEVTPIGERHGH